MIEYKGYTINTNGYAGFWSISKDGKFKTLATQQSAIQWIDLQ